jgi:hypothetical protein
MWRISRIGVMLALAGILSGPTAYSPAMGQTAPAAQKNRAGYSLPWLRKPKQQAHPPLPSRKPAKPEAPAQAETTAAIPVSALDAEALHAGIEPETEPAPPAEPQAKPAEAEAAAAGPAKPDQQAAAAPAPLRKPAGMEPAAQKNEEKTASAPASAVAEPPAPDRKPSPAPAREENTGSVATKKDTARIAPAPPDADAKAESEPATARTAHANAATTLPLPARKPPKPKAPAAKAGDPSPPISRNKDKDKDKDAQKTAGTMSRKVKCLALRECRSGFTRCFSRLEKEVKPELWSAEREKCVAAYKVCIDKYFTDKMDMFFTRYFVPNESCE